MQISLQPALSPFSFVTLAAEFFACSFLKKSVHRWKSDNQPTNDGHEGPKQPLTTIYTVSTNQGRTEKLKRGAGVPEGGGEY